VPYIGPILAAIPPAIIGLAIGWKVALLSFLVYIIVQVIDNVYFIPFMISGKVSINPLLTVLLVLVFAELFGPLGMILSIPIYIIFRIILKESYHLLTHIFPETD
jgi:predicted PurR-regulated permease PerM